MKICDAFLMRDGYNASQSHRNIAGAGKMKCKAATVWILAGCLSMAMAALCAHAQDPGNQKQQQKQKSSPKPVSQPPDTQQQAAPSSQPNGNPFPGDVNSVPVMPSGNEPDIPEPPDIANDPEAAPPRDVDPVRSPEEMGPGESGDTQTFSSSRRGLENIIPDPTTEPADAKGKNGEPADVIPKESAEKDIEVGNYYMDNKNWRGALSRFQSALVLAPENPDVYWGLAECYRHLGQFADARKNYQVVVDYDPDSRHGKEAKKALKEPDLANAAGPKK